MVVSPLSAALFTLAEVTVRVNGKIRKTMKGVTEAVAQGG